MAHEWKLLRAAFWAPIGVCVAAGTALASVTLPPLKDGWWQTTIQTVVTAAGQPPAPATTDITYTCENAAAWAVGIKALTSIIPGCTLDIEGSGDHYTMAMNCSEVGGTPGSMTSNSTMDYVSDEAIHMVGVVKSDVPALQMNETDHTVQDTKWLGACPAGVVPGDFGAMQNGVFQKTNNLLAN